MAGIPWDRWIYHLDYKQEQVNTFHREAVEAQNYILENSAKATRRTEQLKTLVTKNQALSIVVTHSALPDLDWEGMKTKVDALESPPIGSIPANLVSTISEFIGGTLILKSAWRFGVCMTKFLPVEFRQGFAKVMPGFKSSVASLSREGRRAGTTSSEETDGNIELDAPEGVGELPVGELPATEEPIGTETAELTADRIGLDATEEMAAGQYFRASLKEFAGMGAGLAVAIGIDVACGAISGKSESDKLDKEIETLRECSNKLKKAKDSFTKRIAAAENRIYEQQRIMLDFAKQFNMFFNSHPEVPTPEISRENLDEHLGYFMSYAEAMLQHYAYYYTVRGMWRNAVLRRPGITKSEFVASILLVAPEKYTEEQVAKVYDWCSQHSASMAAAKA